MILKKISGCVADSLSANNIEEIDMTDEQRQNVIDHICKELKKHPEQLNYVLQELIPIFGDFTSTDKPCECCGDYIDTYTWVIEEK